jgi:hypothetical protein
MKPCFTIRDLMWLLVIVALLVGWGVDRFWYSMINRENAQLKAHLSDSEKYIQQLEHEKAERREASARRHDMRAAAEEAAKTLYP